jgi:uncharacterized membrane protein YeaQ/YmgE (transglycosylase-associated protein family)
MGTIGIVVLIAAALVVGAVAQYSLRARWGYEGAFTALAAAVGGFVASEYLGTLSAIGPQYDGLAIIPALVGALVLAALAELAMRATGQPAA